MSKNDELPRAVFEEMQALRDVMGRIPANPNVTKADLDRLLAALKAEATSKAKDDDRLETPLESALELDETSEEKP